jgi:hypothetical protein
MRLHDNDQLVNAVLGNNRCLFWESYEHINTMCAQNADLLNVIVGGTYSYQ